MSEQNDVQKKFNELKEDYNDLEELPKEHKRRQSEEQRINKAYQKLLKLVQGKSKKVSEDESAILRWGEDRALIKPLDRERLHKHECDNEAKGRAIVVQKPPPAFKLRLNDEVKFYETFDRSRKQTVYSLFVEHQRRKTGTKSDYIKVAKGDLSMEDLPNEGRVEVLKFNLVKTEFKKYFEIEEAA